MQLPLSDPEPNGAWLRAVGIGDGQGSAERELGRGHFCPPATAAIITLPLPSPFPPQTLQPPK